ncbi:hypothetical protein ACIO52_02730 [Nocardia sp. NPDC087230]|uniref:hypothetical protein n=1 Tax=Nocardia sp. NPDC087230 TaxID=3364331 RepID=UPI003807BCC0
MHSVLLASYDLMAQLLNPTPQAPPMSDKIVQLVRYFTWFILLSGVIAITYFSSSAGSVRVVQQIPDLDGLSLC